MNSTETQSASNHGTTPGGTIVVNWPSGAPHAGQLIICAVYTNGGTFFAISDSAGGTWQTGATILLSPFQITLLYRVVGPSENWGATPSVSVTNITASLTIADIFEFGGFTGTPTLDQSANKSNATATTSSTDTVPQLTYPGATELIFAALGWNNTGGAAATGYAWNGTNVGTLTRGYTTNFTFQEAFGTGTNNSGGNSFQFTWAAGRVSASAVMTFVDLNTATGSISFSGSAQAQVTAPGSISFGGSADELSVPASGSIAFSGSAAPTGSNASGSISFLGSTASISTATGSISVSGNPAGVGANAQGSIAFAGTATGSAASSTAPFMTAIPGLLLPGAALIGAAPFIAVGLSPAVGSISFAGNADRLSAPAAGSIAFGGSSSTGVTVLGSFAFTGTGSGTPTGDYGAPGAITFSGGADDPGLDANGSTTFAGTGSGTAGYFVAGSVRFAGLADQLSAAVNGSITFLGHPTLSVPGAVVISDAAANLVVIGDSL